MLNYILPPIIIIACVSILIVFLFRKIEQLPESELSYDEPVKQPEKKFSALSSFVWQLILKFLERLMHRAKLTSLKFHNTSNDLFQSIREKRQEKTRIQQQAVEKEIQAETQLSPEILKVQKPYNADIRAGGVESRPMIAREVTHPEKKKIVEKNKLEDVLIKRIAINPRDIEAYERLGDYYLESKNYQDSLECFKQVLWLSPTHQKARLRIRRLQRMEK